MPVTIAFVFTATGGLPCPVPDVCHVVVYFTPNYTPASVKGVTSAFLTPSHGISEPMFPNLEALAPRYPTNVGFKSVVTLPPHRDAPRDFLLPMPPLCTRSEGPTSFRSFLPRCPGETSPANPPSSLLRWAGALMGDRDAEGKDGGDERGRDSDLRWRTWVHCRRPLRTASVSRPSPPSFLSLSPVKGAGVLLGMKDSAGPFCSNQFMWKDNCHFERGARVPQILPNTET